MSTPRYGFVAADASGDSWRRSHSSQPARTSDGPSSPSELMDLKSKIKHGLHGLRARITRKVEPRRAKRPNLLQGSAQVSTQRPILTFRVIRALNPCNPRYSFHPFNELTKTKRRSIRTRPRGSSDRPFPRSRLGGSANNNTTTTRSSHLTKPPPTPASTVILRPRSRGSTTVPIAARTSNVRRDQQ
jgi:hypothetical protein